MTTATTASAALGLALLGIGLSPSRADACSPPPCMLGAFVPTAGATVPVNAPGLYWRPTREYGTTTAQAAGTLVRTDAPTVSIAYTMQTLDDGAVLIVPSTPLVEGEYRLVDTTECSPGYNPEVATTFLVGPAQPMPTSLGALTETASTIGELQVATLGGSCDIDVDAAQASVELMPDASSEPWISMLHFTTLVDGQRWSPSSSLRSDMVPGASWVGRGKDKIYVVCEDDADERGTTEGTHVVTMEARLPGTSQVWTSSPVTIELACDPGQGSGSGSGSATSESDGGGCSTGSGSGGALATLGFVLVLRRRRR